MHFGSAFPIADPDTMEKAQKLVEVLTASLDTDDNTVRERETERQRRVQEENAALARGEECELARMLRQEEAAGIRSPQQATRSNAEHDQNAVDTATSAAMAINQASPVEDKAVTEPEHSLEVSTKRLVLKIQLPLVTSAGDIDAGVLNQVFELEVPGIYALKVLLPSPINEEQMTSKYDKKKMCLTVKMPLL